MPAYGVLEYWLTLSLSAISSLSLLLSPPYAPMHIMYSFYSNSSVVWVRYLWRSWSPSSWMCTLGAAGQRCPTFLAPGTGFMEEHFSVNWWGQGWFWDDVIAQLVKNLPAMQETRVRSLGWEDPLEKEIATHSSILAWRIPRTEVPGRLQSMGSQESDTTDWLKRERGTVHLLWALF